uniref:Uncharacterized protein n=1 Tax=Romanomermis culicivorax TaxID=13658 RepID=A0A915KGT9_ROMCU
MMLKLIHFDLCIKAAVWDSCRQLKLGRESQNLPVLRASDGYNNHCLPQLDPHTEYPNYPACYLLPCHFMKLPLERLSHSDVSLQENARVIPMNVFNVSCISLMTYI